MPDGAWGCLVVMVTTTYLGQDHSEPARFLKVIPQVTYQVGSYLIYPIQGDKARRYRALRANLVPPSPASPSSFYALAQLPWSEKGSGRGRKTSDYLQSGTIEMAQRNRYKVLGQGLAQDEQSMSATITAELYESRIGSKINSFFSRVLVCKLLKKKSQ